MDIEIPRETLKTGHEMPKVGLGTWKLTGEDCLRAVPLALAMGYDQIDTADVYGNHREIAPALREVDRDSLWITSKVNRGSLRYDDVLATCEKNLEELGIDCLDLYLIHWPDPEAPMAETFRALGRLVDEGMTRAIGVSNFMVEHLTEALAVSEVPIVNNQIKFNPAHQPWEVVELCRENEIAVTAYSPLMHGDAPGHEVLREIARELERTPVQVALRWLLQQEMIVIPKATSEAHLRENLQILDWELSPEQDARIRALA